MRRQLLLLSSAKDPSPRFSAIGRARSGSDVEAVEFGLTILLLNVSRNEEHDEGEEEI